MIEKTLDLIIAIFLKMINLYPTWWKKLRRGKTEPNFSKIYHVFYLTNVSRDMKTSEPIWKHGLEQLAFKGRTVNGQRSVCDDPADSSSYTLTGKNRYGRIALFDVCDGDETNFAYILYPSLAYRRRLIGIWLGIGADMAVTAGTIILSETMLSEEELNMHSATAVRFLSQGIYKDGRKAIMQR